MGVGHQKPRTAVTPASDVAIPQVIARFDTIDGARRAVTALGLAGVGGEYISLKVLGASEAATVSTTGETDARMLLHLLRYIIIGAVIGTVVGAIISPFVGWIVLLWLDLDVTVQSMLISLLLTTLMSHMVGGFIGYAVAMQAGESWEQSFHDVPGPVEVIVRSNREDIIERAGRAMRRQQPAYISENS